MRFFYLLLLLLGPFITYSAEQIAKTSPPKWVTKVDISNDSILEGGGGFQYLVVDFQINLINKAKYGHYAIQVFNSEGIQSMSDIDISYDPSYQKLQIHKIQLIRDGSIIDKLNSDIQIIQRETSMERSIYDGSLSAVVNLSDVRENDIIEYSYSIIGFNPINKGHYSAMNVLQYTLPANRVYHKLVAPKNKYIQYKLYNSAGEPQINRTTQKVEYIWDVSALDYTLYDNSVPAWHEPYKQVGITTFRDWGEVVEWALPMFEYSDFQFEEVNKKLENIVSKEDKILYIIRFVQDEIRYLGFEKGIFAYKPHHPLKVYNQRYGDCKDKSLLLISLLRSQGISAYPLWVNTNILQEVNNRLPNYAAFNHSVVYFEYNGKEYFIDPTISLQGGNIDHIYFPNYRIGLLIKPQEISLLEIPISTVATYSINEYITIDSIGGDADFTIKSEYTGRKADYLRADFNTNSKDIIHKDYLNYYSNLYPRIESVGTMKLIDDRDSSNIFAVEEHYRIREFWEKHNESTIYCEVYPLVLESMIGYKNSADRSMPYFLGEPIIFKQTTILELPENWNFTNHENEISGESFTYKKKVEGEGKILTAVHSYELIKNHIPAVSVEAFLKKHEEIQNELTYQLTYTTGEGTAANKISWLSVLLAVMALGISFFFARRIYKDYNPKLIDNAENLTIGGWIVLPAIGLTISPLMITYQVISNNYFDQFSWDVIFASVTYNPISFATLFGAELVYNTILVSFNILILILFYQRRSSVPRLISIYYAVLLIGLIAEAIAIEQIAPDLLTSEESEETIKELVKSFIAAAIWIPYFNASKRVKNTFCKRLDENDNLVLESVDN